MSAVRPQMSAAPQPPRSSTDQPSEPSMKPGFARQMTNPSYQRSDFRSWRSSTTATPTPASPATASAMLPPLVHESSSTGARANLTPFRARFNTRPGRAAAPYNRLEMARPPITITCECGEIKRVPYGERWAVRHAGVRGTRSRSRSRSTTVCMRRMRRHKLEALVAAAIALAVFVPLVFMSPRFFLLLPPAMMVWLFCFLPYWRRRYRRTAQRRTALATPPRIAC